jgi:hypothetical protein
MMSPHLYLPNDAKIVQIAATLSRSNLVIVPHPQTVHQKDTHLFPSFQHTPTTAVAAPSAVAITTAATLQAGEDLSAVSHIKISFFSHPAF